MATILSQVGTNSGCCYRRHDDMDAQDVKSMRSKEQNYKSSIKEPIVLGTVLTFILYALDPNFGRVHSWGWSVIWQPLQFENGIYFGGREIRLISNSSDDSIITPPGMISYEITKKTLHRAIKKILGCNLLLKRKHRSSCECVWNEVNSQIFVKSQKRM